jgi:hypothetical protein
MKDMEKFLDNATEKMNHNDFIQRKNYKIIQEKHSKNKNDKYPLNHFQSPL